MKKIIYISVLSLLVFSCGEKSKVNIDETLESNDLTKIKESRDIVHSEYEKLGADLARLDAAIDSLNPNKKLPLVQSLTIKDTAFTHFIEIQGNVDTKQNIIIYPEMSGVLLKLNVKTGQKVSKGQILATIDDGGIGSQVAQAKAQLSLAQTTFERQKRLWDQKIGSEMQFLEAQTNLESQKKVVAQLQSQQGKTIIKAPFSGTIDEVMTERGKVVSPGQDLFRIVSLNDMYVSATVPESYLEQVKLGAVVNVYLQSIGKTYKGKVRQVGNFINPSNRSFGIEVALPNPENLLRPNQVAILKIEDYTNKSSVLVPENIIQQKAGGRLVVYTVEKKEGKKELVAIENEVKTGYTSGAYVEIKSGLKVGDTVITEGAKAVEDGTEVKVIK
ncbi:efflux RND transporter periplasmic adaptor subunit [Flavobacterium arcticum]|uniref:Efflux RND transporter periplasmic adaptor subunit n=1 Tax=Flavobacterium arcticum TaxID=1784713 RepID=A0A345HAA0_9FLAO|nr:efflux RND transporter periplasmic adaptor subunit [Flavobacterium arcticum]AXG73510.1 efflux RND transporter periplasmic adaptor subunit [Flavobacterium arcticum]KAF2513300.1 efflux RND transporter periplasmic adaptor subunit [Flavobacterium arcticum]